MTTLQELNNLYGKHIGYTTENLFLVMQDLFIYAHEIGIEEVSVTKTEMAMIVWFLVVENKGVPVDILKSGEIGSFLGVKLSTSQTE
jgi:hypothetical protein